MRDKLFILELIETEAITCFARVVVVLDISNHAMVYLYLHIVCLRIFFLVTIHSLEVQLHHISLRNDISCQGERQRTDQYARDHVWSEETLETHASGNDSNNL